jgi:hypothetical protein
VSKAEWKAYFALGVTVVFVVWAYENMLVKPFPAIAANGMRINAVTTVKVRKRDNLIVGITNIQGTIC